MGRPCKLTSEVQDRIVKAVRAGAYQEIAATLAGICRTTFFRWMVAGEESKRNGKFRDFWNAVKKAEAEWEEEQVEGIQATAQGGQLLSRTTTERKGGEIVVSETFSRPEWTARAWLLERKLYERWGKKERVELTGDKTRPLHIIYAKGEEKEA